MEIAYEINATVITELQLFWIGRFKVVQVQTQGSTPCYPANLRINYPKTDGFETID